MNARSPRRHLDERAASTPPTAFVIVPDPQQSVAIAAGGEAGQGVTLQPLDFANGQLAWAPIVVNAAGWTGVAFYNPASGLYATYNGTGQQLVMQAYDPRSTFQYAWYLTQGQSDGSFRIAYPAAPQWTWNDGGGQFQVNDPVITFDDASANSLWQLLPYSLG